MHRVDPPATDHPPPPTSVEPIRSGYRFMDCLEFAARRKELLAKVFATAMIVTYLGVFFLVEEQFEATATIIPNEDESSVMGVGALRGLKGLPFSLGSGAGASEMDMYKTIIQSRTLMEQVIAEFHLLDVYGMDTSDPSHMENAIKRLRKEVGTQETEESAFQVTVRASKPDRAAKMANYIVRVMNERIIDLKVRRSRENRVFLERRVDEIRDKLKHAEDSLRVFQERTGLLDAKIQVQGILAANTSLETELTAKRFQKGLYERLYDKNSPQVRELDLQIQEYERTLGRLRSQGEKGSPLLPLANLPRTSVEFLRRYREVELNNLLLEYAIPLYEQAKVEEKKDTPVLQVIDNAIPPSKKTWPPRTLISLASALSITTIFFTTLLARTAIAGSTNTRLQEIISGLGRWNWKRQQRT